MTRDANELGASLYMPATRGDLLEVVRGEKLTQVRSIIFCTEDSVNERDLSAAVENLRVPLAALRRTTQQMRFVRVRNPDVMRQLLCLPGIEELDGFVLPKVTRSVLSEYLHLLHGSGHLLMPTLETREVFEEQEMMALRRALEKDGVQERVLALRIGGNDLLSILGMRRPRGRTLYQTPLGPVIARLVTIFKPSGFNLSAPVFEYLSDIVTLQREVEDDLAHGLVGKTAIHPDQVPWIHACYRVHAADMEMAEHILRDDAPAVFRMHDAMCEASTHRNWAQNIHKTASCFGLQQSDTANSVAA
ncbi:HpcH/HpaI aldolase/citrate lyase family protein [Thiorhodospira sibirica]|uniref:HpcH/HpaI aldolase/citrate lyase family protein n=1 Tax=Thiorhodospira sibirica TaxID=154347 RepID=UPI00022C1D13|nr:HpcH/HpaI aldolase/citrate lyase family protein [Thiorhodospira sibirica]